VLPDGKCIFKPKMPLWVNFGVSCSERSWSILWTFRLFYCHWVHLNGHLVYFVVILVYFLRFGTLCQEKSGNPGRNVVVMLRFFARAIPRTRVARFTLVQHTKTGKIYQMTIKRSNVHKIYQIYTKWPQNIPNGGKIDQTNIKCTNIFHRKNLQSLPKLGFSGLKIDHLATPPRTCIYFRFVSIMQVIVQKRPDTPFNQSQPKHSNGWFRATN
jgi:hypothetical protein